MIAGGTGGLHPTPSVPTSTPCQCPASQCATTIAPSDSTPPELAGGGIFARTHVGSFFDTTNCEIVRCSVPLPMLPWIAPSSAAWPPQFALATVDGMPGGATVGTTTDVLVVAADAGTTDVGVATC